jgi:formylglycine-generating enzyme required for sulfatase activity
MNFGVLYETTSLPGAIAPPSVEPVQPVLLKGMLEMNRQHHGPLSTEVLSGVPRFILARARLLRTMLAANLLLTFVSGRLASAGDDIAAASPAQMKPYTEHISGTNVSFDMVPIVGGTFLMGSPASEAGHQPDEQPQHQVTVDSFWMGKCEVTWNEYEIWTFSLDIQRRNLNNIEPTERDKLADAVTRPTKPYTDMTFGMGKEGYPAICMTQWAAKKYCEWLSAKTGHYYRLPTEAEWEYAARAGTTTAYSFGDDPAQLGEYAWYFENSEDAYHPVGKKKPNPWGLYDMHGNVAEWCLDRYDVSFYTTLGRDKPAVNPYNPPKGPYPHVVRGGSWDDDAVRLRSAARRGSDKSWKVQDPQIPQSIWYFTDALFVGFRVVRPLVEPSAELKAAYLAAGTEKE